jgi:hypothetical protein
MESLRSKSKNASKDFNFCILWPLIAKPKRFVTHKFTTRWEDVHCRLCMDSLPSNTILSHIDFVENYNFEMQNEIQSMHWHSFQVTILVHITFWVDQINGEGNNDKKIIKETQLYVSNDKDHDTLFMQHCFLMYWDWLSSCGIKLAHHWVWSDGCVGQFKGWQNFVAWYLGFTNGCSMTWSFFGIGHGKGEWDGVGAMVKNTLKNKQIHLLVRCFTHPKCYCIMMFKNLLQFL